MTENQKEDVEDKAISLAKSWGLMGTVFFIITLLYINANTYGLVSEVVLGYGFLLVGYKTWFDIDLKTIKNFGGWAAPLNKTFEKWELKKDSLARSFFYYVPAFAATFAVLIILEFIGIINSQTISPGIVWGQTIYHIAVVSTCETIIFHVIMPFLLMGFFTQHIGFKAALLLTILVSQFSFSIFHFGAYEGNLGNLTLAFIVGLVLILISLYISIAACIAAHASFNLYVIGVTTFSWVSGGSSSGSGALSIMVDNFALPVTILLLLLSGVIIIKKFKFNLKSFRLKEAIKNGS